MKHVDLGCVNSRAEFERKFRIAAEGSNSIHCSMMLHMFPLLLKTLPLYLMLS
jgi:hypothetical protein